MVQAVLVAHYFPFQIIHQRENGNCSQEDGEAPTNMHEDAAYMMQNHECETASEPSSQITGAGPSQDATSQAGPSQQNPCRRGSLGPQEKKTRQPSNANLLAQLIEGQRQLRLLLEKGIQKEEDFRDKQIQLQEQSAQRDSLFLSCLRDLCKK